ncbi:MAG TPA: hypothetical protein PK280_03030 [Planctomycetota bacterium]|nr:hypothetical protein [Planctomycetota bacterium]
MINRALLTVSCLLACGGLCPPPAGGACAGEPGANPIRPAEPPGAGTPGPTDPSTAGGAPVNRVRVKVLRPTEPGEREVILETAELTVTVRETTREFTVAVQKTGGAAELSSAPNRAEFQKKHPELWKRWAEPALDATDPDKLAIEAIVRQTLPQILAIFAKERGREATPEERAEAEKVLREEARKAIEARRAKDKEAAKDAEKPKP